jgi:hypothetical protein
MRRATGSKLSIASATTLQSQAQMARSISSRSSTQSSNSSAHPGSLQITFTCHMRLMIAPAPDVPA